MQLMTYDQWERKRRSEKRQKKVLSRLNQIITLQGLIMASVQQIRTDLADTKALVVQLIGIVVGNDVIVAELKQKIADLVAAAGIAQTEKDALQVEIDAAFAEAEDLENTARAGVPGVPPTGGTPLLPSYADRAAFDTAVADYKGPEQVMLDGTEVKAASDGSTDVLTYYTHSATGAVDTSPPTD